jgi:hypothetical protein
MLDKKSEILIDASKKVYSYLIETISNIYDNAFSGKVKWAKNEVLQDFDAYMQAMLTSVALSNGKLTQAEVELIGSLTKYGTLFENLDIKLFANCNYEMRDRLRKICDEALAKLPIACWLSGVVDIKQNKKVTKTILDNLIKLGFNLSSIDGVADMNSIKKSLKSITDFIIEKQIKLN